MEVTRGVVGALIVYGNSPFKADDVFSSPRRWAFLFERPSSLVFLGGCVVAGKKISALSTLLVIREDGGMWKDIPAAPSLFSIFAWNVINAEHFTRYWKSPTYYNCLLLFSGFFWRSRFKLVFQNQGLRFWAPLYKSEVRPYLIMTLYIYICMLPQNPKQLLLLKKLVSGFFF